MFYPMAALLVVILFACKLMPKLGKMKDAYTDLEKKEQTPEHPKCTMPLPLTLPWPE